MRLIDRGLPDSIVDALREKLAEIVSNDVAGMSGVALLLPDCKFDQANIRDWIRGIFVGIDYYLAVYVCNDGLALGMAKRPGDSACLFCRNFWTKETHESWRPFSLQIDENGIRICKRLIELKLEALKTAGAGEGYGVETAVRIKDGCIVGLENHVYAAVANCENCGSPKSRSDETSLLSTILADKKFGVVSRLGMLPDEDGPDDHWPFIYVAEGESGGIRITASGKDLNREVALAKTTSEFLERRAMFSAEEPAGVTVKSMGEVFDSFEDYCAFGGIARVDWSELREARIQCIQAPNVGRGGLRTLPIQIFLPRCDEPRFFNVTSSGCAARKHLGDAIDDGLWEAIERDAFLRAWHRCEIEAEVQLQKTGHFQKLLWERERLAFDMYLLDAIGGFVFLAVGYSDAPRPQIQFACGLGAGATPEFAIASAQNELCQVIAALNGKIRYGDGAIRAYELMNGEAAVETPSDHALRFVFEDPRERAFRIHAKLGSGQWMEYITERPRTAIDVVRQQHDIFVYAIKDTVTASFGFEVAKICVPFLIPFYIGEKGLPLNLVGCKNSLPHPLA